MTRSSIRTGARVNVVIVINHSDLEGHTTSSSNCRGKTRYNIRATS
jgi:hypothetical protein